jgi:hypothetical protein
LGAGLGLALTLERSRQLLPIDRPEGVVQRFLLAVDGRRYEEAYGYFSASTKAECSFQDFYRLASSYHPYERRTLTLGQVEVRGSEATVWVRYGQDDPFADYGYQQPYHLVREEGQWRIDIAAGPPGPPTFWCPPRPLPTPVRPQP